jgi:hypothetical protein
MARRSAGHPVGIFRSQNWNCDSYSGYEKYLLDGPHLRAMTMFIQVNYF